MGSEAPISGCVNCVDQAIEFVANRLDRSPAGVGVDAPLWWSSGLSGDRQVDRWLRRTYGFSGGQVQTVNSLRGAAVVQGLMFVARIRELFPLVPVTETHPKALLAVSAVRWKLMQCCDTLPPEEHERDAVISAIAAREGFEGRWSRDLSIDRYPSEQNPGSYWLAPVHYFWPD